MDRTEKAGPKRESRGYVVFDLEATCWARGREQAPSETTKTGALRFDPAPRAEGKLPEFQTFVRPFMAPKISEYCTELNTIRQTDVDATAGFPQALAAFHRWSAAEGDFTLAARGSYDGAQTAGDCAKHGIDNPFESMPYVDVKRASARKLGPSRSLGLGGALGNLGLRQEGIADRAPADARSLVRRLQAGVAEGL